MIHASTLLTRKSLWWAITKNSSLPRREQINIVHKCYDCAKRRCGVNRVFRQILDKSQNVSYTYGLGERQSMPAAGKPIFCSHPRAIEPACARAPASQGRAPANWRWPAGPPFRLSLVSEKSNSQGGRVPRLNHRPHPEERSEGFASRRMLQSAAPARRVLDRPSRRVFSAPQDEGVGGYKVAQKRTQATEIIGARKLVRRAKQGFAGADASPTPRFAGYSLTAPVRLET